MGHQVDIAEKQRVKRETDAGVAAIDSFFSARGPTVQGTVDDIRKLIGGKSMIIQRGWAELRASGRLQKNDSGWSLGV